MGDRGCIVLHEGKSAIWCYTHWNAASLPATLCRALVKGKSRWFDAPYLHRIIFQELIGDDATTSGFGLTTLPMDYDRPPVHVDVRKQRVTIGSDVWSFAEFVREFINA